MSDLKTPREMDSLEWAVLVTDNLDHPEDAELEWFEGEHAARKHAAASLRDAIAMQDGSVSVFVLHCVAQGQYTPLKREVE